MHYLDKFKYCPACGSANFAEHDFKSKRCKDCGFTYYFNSAAATVAIIENERGELLIGRRACEPAKDTLDLIGGFVDPGENSEQAIVREIREETGIEVKEEQLTFLFSLPNTYNFSNFLVHTTDAFFHVKIDSSTSFSAKDDVAECWWIAKDKLNVEEIGLDSVREGTRRWIENNNKNHNLPLT
ncbi:MAG: NUDIX domain-containing protein [Prevotellaceae bacterium]|nr:NUDIX domain-containing protein [Candidatus Minthosoma caballi]